MRKPTKLELAYLAGVIDSDGHIGIKRNTYAMRVRGDAGQPIYAERIDIKQVQPQAVELARACFGGWLGITKAYAKFGKPLHSWHCHSAMAGKALAMLLPYLRIKKAQAGNALALRALIGKGRRWPVPKIVPGEPLVGVVEFASLTGAGHPTIYQAARLGSIPSIKKGRRRMIPASYAPAYRARLENTGSPPRDAAVTAAMERLFLRSKELNHAGTA